MILKFYEEVASSAGGRTSWIGDDHAVSQSAVVDAWIMNLGILLEQIKNLRFYSESLCDMTLLVLSFGVDG